MPHLTDCRPGGPVTGRPGDGAAPDGQDRPEDAWMTAELTRTRMTGTTGMPGEMRSDR